MNLTATVGKLADALELAAGVLDSSPKVEALGAIRLEAAEGWANIMANALERVLTTRCAAVVNEDGVIAVPGAALAKLVGGFDAEESVSISSGEKAVTVTCGRRRYRLPKIPLDHLPAAPAIGDETGRSEVRHEDLLDLLRRPAFAASTETTRFYLNGIFLQNIGSNLVSVGTDGARLCRVSTPASGVLSNDHTLILPLVSAKLLVKLLMRTKGETATVQRSMALIEIVMPTFTFVSNLIDASYPDYERIIPKLSTSHTTVDRRELARALERLQAVVDGETKVAAIVGLTWSGNGALRLGLPRQRDSADDIIDAEASGECQIAIALGQLAELVDEMPGDRLRLHVCGAMEPMIVVDPDDAGILILQMPMMWTFTQESEAA